MIKIGDFSKLAHVTVKTLHHYGELGLLRPTHIDRYTGYRYYSLNQLPRLNRILALKNLGFSLEQVVDLLDEKLSLEEMRGMLRMKKIELAQRVGTEQARLAQVEMRLRQIEAEGHPPQHEVALKNVPPMTVLTAKAVAASETAFMSIRRSLQDMLRSNLERAHIKADGPFFALVANLPHAESDLVIELAIPVQLGRSQRAGDWGSNPVQLREMGAVANMASMVYDGNYSTLASIYTALYTWTKTNAYQVTGPYREVYLSETGIALQEESDASGFIEVQCPVQRASIPISVLSTHINQKESIMKPKFLNKSAFTTVGLSYVGKNQEGEIPQLWGTFNQKSHEIKNMVGQAAYGACFSGPETAEKGEFEYVACFEVSNTNDIPDGMVIRDVPANKYAVFTHHGKLDTLQETYKYIYETWLPQSGLEMASPHFDMEVYDDRFEFDSDKSEFDIYVAVKE